MFKKSWPIFLLFCSCGTNVPRDIDPYFDDFTNEFKMEADSREVSYSNFDKVTVMKFEDTVVPNRLAECQKRIVKKNKFYKTEHFNKIVFTEAFRNLSRENQFIIFVHEIGHCVYDLEHTDNPDDIMYASNHFSFLSLETRLDQFFDEAKKHT